MRTTLFSLVRLHSPRSALLAAVARGAAVAALAAAFLFYLSSAFCSLRAAEHLPHHYKMSTMRQTRSSPMSQADKVDKPVKTVSGSAHAKLNVSSRKKAVKPAKVGEEDTVRQMDAPQQEQLARAIKHAVYLISGAPEGAPLNQKMLNELSGRIVNKQRGKGKRKTALSVPWGNSKANRWSREQIEKATDHLNWLMSNKYKAASWSAATHTERLISLHLSPEQSH